MFRSRDVGDTKNGDRHRARYRALSHRSLDPSLRLHDPANRVAAWGCKLAERLEEPRRFFTRLVELTDYVPASPLYSTTRSTEFFDRLSALGSRGLPRDLSDHVREDHAHIWNVDYGEPGWVALGDLYQWRARRVQPRRRRRETSVVDEAFDRLWASMRKQPGDVRLVYWFF
jgi:hypothetical protein